MADQKRKSKSSRFFKHGINSEWFIFFWCLMIALVFWFLKALEDNYTYTLEFNMQFENLPENRVFTSPLPERIMVRVNAPGWQLAGYRFQQGKSDLVLDFGRIGSRPHFLPAENASMFAEQIPSQMEITGFYPDTLHLEHEEKITRKLPVQADLEIQTARDHGLRGAITYQPDSVEVSGAYSNISGLHKVTTETLTLKNLSESREETVRLQKPPGFGNEVSPESIKITIPVERVTEKKLVASLKVRNPHPDYTISLVPDMVNITFQVPLSRYARIDDDSFDLYIDAEEALIDSLNRLPVHIESAPGYIYNVRLQPRYVDYYLTPNND